MGVKLVRRLKILNAVGAVVGVFVVLLAVVLATADCLDYCENGVQWSTADIVSVAIAGAAYLMTLVALYLSLAGHPVARRATRIAWLGWAAWPSVLLAIEFF